MVNEFNQYAKKNNLNISVNLNLLTGTNTTKTFSDYIITVETLMEKKNNKYDLYFFDNSFTSHYGEYLLDLSKYISKDYVDLFDTEIISQTCLYENKIVSLVNFFLIISFYHSFYIYTYLIYFNKIKIKLFL